MVQYLYTLAFWKGGEGRSSHKMHGKSCKSCIITGVKFCHVAKCYMGLKMGRYADLTYGSGYHGETVCSCLCNQK